MTSRGLSCANRQQVVVASFVGVSLFAAVVGAATGALAGPYDWTGAYGGVHAGGVWGNASVTDTNGGVTPGPFSYSPSGAFGGATAGLNWQGGNFVAGVEGDIGYLDLSGASKIESSHDSIYHQNITLDGGLYGDVTGRLGYVFGQTLVYGKGGFAFYDGEASQGTTFPGYVTTGTGTFTGWTAGGGIERHLTPNLSLKVEYLHFDFGSQGGYQTNEGDTSSPIGYQFDNSTAVTGDSVKVGLNWQFGGQANGTP